MRRSWSDANHQPLVPAVSGGPVGKDGHRAVVYRVIPFHLGLECEERSIGDICQPISAVYLGILDAAMRIERMAELFESLWRVIRTARDATSGEQD